MIAILQPFIPHYREDFFKDIRKNQPCDIYCYETGRIKKDKFEKADISITSIKSLEVKNILFYNPFPLCKKKYKSLVLMLNVAHLTTWLLLLTKFIHGKKIILWGHGISVKRYLKESRKPSIIMRWMIQLSDGVWFYTDTEQQIWRHQIPSLKSVALNNTISDVDEIVRHPVINKEGLRKKYGISQQRVFIYCARFNIAERRVDLLEKLIRKLDSERFGFIIIGDGPLKPDFRKYKNVYDFGGLYDREIKQELFHLADIYFQPGWIGLSVVEAMAYAKPVFAFKRSSQIPHCVEYSYVEDGVNGLLFDNLESLAEAVERIENKALMEMGEKGRQFAKESLSMKHMVDAGLSLIENLKVKTPGLFQPQW